MDRLLNTMVMENKDKGKFDTPGVTGYNGEDGDVTKKSYRAHGNIPFRVTKNGVCPICGKEYSGFPALSRKDGKTEICPDCGMREAFEAFGYSREMVEESIAEIHRLEKKIR